MKDRHIRIGEQLWKELEKEAQAKQLSISAYIRLVLMNREK